MMNIYFRREFLRLPLLLFFFFFSTTSLFYGQKSISYKEVKKTNDPAKIAAFLKSNPQHPGNAELKHKLVELINSSDYQVAKPEIKPIPRTELKKKLEKKIETATNDADAQKAAQLLTHLFNNDPNRKEAYVQIENTSKCNLIIKFEGKDFYQLNVPAQGKNYILVKRGKYKLSTLVCNTKYEETQNLTSDIVIRLNHKK